MSSMIVKPPDDEHAYEQIEAAVMETSRGRWFLNEYARRNRHADYAREVLAALSPPNVACPMHVRKRNA